MVDIEYEREQTFKECLEMVTSEINDIDFCTEIILGYWLHGYLYDDDKETLFSILEEKAVYNPNLPRA